MYTVWVICLQSNPGLSYVRSSDIRQRLPGAVSRSHTRREKMICYM